MIRYKIVSANTIFDRVHKNFIPVDEGNIDYQRYLRWVAEGNVAEPPDPPRVEDPDDSENIARISKKLRRLTQRLKALLPSLDVNDIL